MSADTVKAIQMSHMENELQEIMKDIRMTTGKLNFMNANYYTSSKEKKWIEEKLLRLIAQKKLLENKITEGMLLE
jgi:hypothetical protein